MTLRRLAVAGCVLAAIATSACTVRTVPAEPHKPVYVPANTPVTTGAARKPGKVVKAPAKQRATPPGQAKHGNEVPPGPGAMPPGQKKKAALSAPGQKGPAQGQSRKPATPKGLANKPVKTPPPTPGAQSQAPKAQARTSTAPAQTGPRPPKGPSGQHGPAKADQQGPTTPKGKPADAPWKGDALKTQAKTASEPLPAAKGKPTPLVNKPPKGEEDEAETPAKQARGEPKESPANAPKASPGKGKGNGKGNGKADGKTKQPI